MMWMQLHINLFLCKITQCMKTEDYSLMSVSDALVLNV